MAQQIEEEWIGLREFARRVNVNPSAVQKGVANGRIQRRESDKRFHWPSQKAAWDSNLDASKVRDHNGTANAKKTVSTPIAPAPAAKPKGKKKSKPAPQTHEEFEAQQNTDDDEEEEEDEPEEVGPDAIVLNYEKARKERATANLKEIEVGEKLGELVQQSYVRSAMLKFAVELRDAILDIPDRVASALAAEILSRIPAGVGFDSETLEALVKVLWEKESSEVLEKLAHGDNS